jgi:hypothetical protein
LKRVAELLFAVELMWLPDFVTAYPNHKRIEALVNAAVKAKWKEKFGHDEGTRDKILARLIAWGRKIKAKFDADNIKNTVGLQTDDGAVTTMMHNMARLEGQNAELKNVSDRFFLFDRLSPSPTLPSTHRPWPSSPPPWHNSLFMSVGLRVWCSKSVCRCQHRRKALPPRLHGQAGPPVTPGGTEVDSVVAPVVAPSTAARQRSARLVASTANRVDMMAAAAVNRLAQHTAASAAKVKGRAAAAVTQATPSGPPTAGQKRKSPIDLNKQDAQSKRQKSAPAPKATATPKAKATATPKAKATATPKPKQATPKPKPPARGKK